jgi:hypothetical protein
VEDIFTGLQGRRGHGDERGFCPLAMSIELFEAPKRKKKIKDKYTMFPLLRWGYVYNKVGYCI